MSDKHDEAEPCPWKPCPGCDQPDPVAKKEEGEMIDKELESWKQGYAVGEKDGYKNAKCESHFSEQAIIVLASALLDCEHTLRFPDNKEWVNGSLALAQAAIATVKELGCWPIEDGK